MRFRLLGLLACAAAAVLAADQPTCSATTLCATGCCSKFGFCGVGDTFCGDGCQSTCDYKPPPTDCGPDKPCADKSCCSKFGFCGLGKKYCAADVCVNNCDVKADCDPGDFGKDYVLSSECPLHVCCSKWGYCGVDAEHCSGKKPPKRPSCAKTKDISRVVGYYEGWASRRPCDKFYPDDIPTGVYSHLNFAFASIDPASFKVVPADAGDVALYSKLTVLKHKDPNLKVYIAIGGWAFNDPGPTQSVFSQLAASEIRQRVFFRSLISFMSTYGFDGVDIDWEYPAADDRAGQAVDFKNYPVFIERLSSVLKTVNRGLTITLPVSYWYLRHFDIVAMEPHVDWFNMMSYDLHGSWDKENRWIGNYLNSHTNLTEIEEYFDLLWRNDVSPTKVVMGFGFYSRTFKAADLGCMKAGCHFSSVGNRGACTHEYGVLSNAEIDRLADQTGAKPTLDKDAAVEILVTGDSWITYDDEATFQLKTDFARSQCLGGVMVWAVSLDKKDGTYSKQLQKATKYQSSGVDSVDDGSGGKRVTRSEFINRKQCYWTGCGEPCPHNYQLMQRLDPGAKSGEWMMDSAGCRKNGGLQSLCCPLPSSEAALPDCGWYNFVNGNCASKWKGQCPDGRTEVGSTRVACGSGYQIACCTVSSGDPTKNEKSIDGTAIYGRCNWPSKGIDECGDARSWSKDNGCVNNGDLMTTELLSNWGGSGGHRCVYEEYGTVDIDYYYRRGSYCCDPGLSGRRPQKKWYACEATSPAHRGLDGFCAGTCPDDKTRVGTDNYGNMQRSDRDHGCASGTTYQCCSSVYKTGATPEEVAQSFADALEVVVQHGCPASPDIGTVPSRTTTDLAKRDGSSTAWKACNSVVANVMLWAERPDNSSLTQYLAEAFDGHVHKKYNNLESVWFAGNVNPQFQMEGRDGGDERGFVQAYFDNLDYANKVAGVEQGKLPEAECDFQFKYQLDKRIEDTDTPDYGPGISYEYGEPEDEPPGGALAAAAEEEERTAAPDHSAERRNSTDDDEDDGMPESLRGKTLDEYLAIIFGDKLTDLGKRVSPVPVSPLLALTPDSTSTSSSSSRPLSAFDDDRVHSLVDRAGKTRPYVCFKGRANQVSMQSAPYINGDDGNNLLKATGDTHRYMATPNTRPVGTACQAVAHKLETLGGAADADWASEHIMELQTMSRFVDFLVNKEWPLVRGWLVQEPYVGNIDITIAQIKTYMAKTGWKAWASLGADYAALSPLDLMLTRMGSEAVPEVMVVASQEMNLIKAQLYRTVQPMGNTKWNARCTGDKLANVESAFGIIATIAAVFDYYESPNVKKRHKDAYNKVADLLDDFQKALKQETGVTLKTDLRKIWTDYLVKHLERVVDFATKYMDKRVVPLVAPWEARCRAAVGRNKLFPCSVGAVLKMYQNGLPGQVNRPAFDTSIFT